LDRPSSPQRAKATGGGELRSQFSGLQDGCCPVGQPGLSELI
jgi:hypothetical protein